MRLAFLCTLSLVSLGRPADPGWISLNVTVPEYLLDTEYSESQVRVLIGTPPQPMDLTVYMGGTLLAAWTTDCLYCPGDTAFDMSASSTLEPNNEAWSGNSADSFGMWYHDSIGFGGVLTYPDVDFMAMQRMSTDFDSRMLNGILGLTIDPSETEYLSVFTKMWQAGSLMNPVIGLRLDPFRPRLTIGALDPQDYVGEINWVEAQPGKGVALSSFQVDGMKGYNGSFIPFGKNSLKTVINSLVSDIYVPPNNSYAHEAGFTGPVGPIYNRTDGSFAYPCNLTGDILTMPDVSLAFTINGVDYPMESELNMIRPPSTNKGYCNVALLPTPSGDDVDAILGLPFLRSVYVAYHFPTDNCPGYYGFAFPSGANRTQDQIDQKPTATPSLSSQCLSLSKPTSTPVVSEPNGEVEPAGAFEVYGGGGKQVPLLGFEDLKLVVWNRTLT